METLLRDFRFAFKVLRRRLTLSIAAILCLALGIGATTVVFSLVSGVVLRPLPFEDPDRLFLVWGHFNRLGFDKMATSAPEFATLREDTESFESVGMMLPYFFNLTSSDPPERVTGGRISAGLFDTLGLEMALGRNFTREEEEAKSPVAILGYQTWQRRFAADPNILGRVISLSDVPYEVVGVLPESFSFLLVGAEMWVPWPSFATEPRPLRRRLTVVRIPEGVSAARAGAALDAKAFAMQQEFPDFYPADSGWGMEMTPLREEMVGPFRGQLFALLGAVALVLLIACANVANLLLAQASARGKEVALRASLGASRGSIVRQLLTESVVLALIGGGLGVFLSVWGTSAVLKLDLGSLPRLQEVGLDLRVLAFALLVSVATGLAFGLVPALRASRLDLYDSLKEGGKTAESGGRTPLRNVLVVAEIVLALVVLVGAGLMIRSLQHLRQVDPGFRKDNLLTVQLYLSTTAYPNRLQSRIFYRQLLQELDQYPEIEEVALTSHLPLGVTTYVGGLTIEGREAAPGTPEPQAGWRSVNPQYFQTMEIPLLQGRSFTEADDENAPLVVILEKGLAERLFPGEDPIGRRIELLHPQYAGWREIVGIVGEIQDRHLAEPSEELLYGPFLQMPERTVGLALLTSGDPARLAGTVRQTIRRIDPSQPIDRVQSMRQLLESSISAPKFQRLLFVLFGSAALLLTAIGVYGVLSYSVDLRTREMGLRMAMGADGRDVLRLIVSQAMKLALVGVVAGLALAAAIVLSMRRVLAGMIYGIGSVDLLTYGSVAMLLIVLALVASLVPAWRATRIDPMYALRQE